MNSDVKGTARVANFRNVFQTGKEHAINRELQLAYFFYTLHRTRLLQTIHSNNHSKSSSTPAGSSRRSVLEGRHQPAGCAVLRAVRQCTPTTQRTQHHRIQDWRGRFRPSHCGPLPRTGAVLQQHQPSGAGFAAARTCALHCHTV